jgi:hypothetical protein
MAANTEFRHGDNQFNIFKKILNKLGAGIDVTNDASSPVPVTNVGESNVEQFVGAGLVDSFGRLRVSNPTTVLEGKHVNGTDTDVWDSSLSGALGLDDLTNSTYIMQMNSGGTGYGLHTTFRRAFYQAGKSQLLEITFNFKTMTDYASRAGVTWEAGMGDGAVGIYAGGNGNPTGLSDTWFNRRRPGGENDTVLRADWNV